MCTAFAHPFCACYLCQKRPISVKRDLISCTAFAHPFCVRAMKSKSVHYHKEKENKGSVYRVADDPDPEDAIVGSSSTPLAKKKIVLLE